LINTPAKYNTPSAERGDQLAPIDMKRMRKYRLNRVRAELAERNYGGCILFDPINIRYATGTRNMMIWTQHSPDRFAFIATAGPVILFEREWVSEGTGRLETVDEYRPSLPWYYESAGPRVNHVADTWAEQISELLRLHAGENRRLAIDRIGPAGIAPLQSRGLELFEAQEPMEQARSIKCREEIDCMSISIATLEGGIHEMKESLRPGISENELWSIMHRAAIRGGAEWAETRLLASGGRTNPWFQECSDKLIRAGELVAFDTDFVGPFGYCCDISRTFFCGPGEPSHKQKDLYQRAYEQVQFNMSLLKPGRTFREIAHLAWKVPAGYYRDRFGPFHGIGLVDEYPDIAEAADWDSKGYDGVIQENMTLCVESYVGKPGGDEGVKLEEQVVITKNGFEMLSAYPYEEALLK
jgi:Xaa-Pro dipeptidase